MSNFVVAVALARSIDKYTREIRVYWKHVAPIYPSLTN